MNSTDTHIAAPDPLWFKDAIIYQLHLKSFFDANNDGVGDFEGLLQKLDYVAELGDRGLAAAVLSVTAARRWV
jgi:1,4-alpha-glucan branching enzyme